MTQVTLAEEGLDALFGTQDENLRRIERTFGVDITARGNELHIHGDPEPVERVRRIILARPAVEAGEKLGFLPGDLVEKVNPYLRPLHDALHDIIGYEKVGRMLERGGSSRSRPSPSCAAARSTTASSSSTRRRTPPASSRTEPSAGGPMNRPRPPGVWWSGSVPCGLGGGVDPPPSPSV